MNNHVQKVQKVSELMMAMHHLRKSLSIVEEKDYTSELRTSRFEIGILHSFYETEVVVRSKSSYAHDMISCSVRRMTGGGHIYEHRPSSNRFKIFSTVGSTGLEPVHVRDDNNHYKCNFGSTEEDLFQLSTVQDVPDIEVLKTVREISEVYNFLPPGTYTRTSIHEELFDSLTPDMLNSITNYVWGEVNLIIAGTNL